MAVAHRLALQQHSPITALRRKPSTAAPAPCDWSPPPAGYASPAIDWRTGSLSQPPACMLASNFVPAYDLRRGHPTSAHLLRTFTVSTVFYT